MRSRQQDSRLDKIIFNRVQSTLFEVGTVVFLGFLGLLLLNLATLALVLDLLQVDLQPWITIYDRGVSLLIFAFVGDITALLRLVE
jgi:hypothetical protein